MSSMREGQEVTVKVKGVPVIARYKGWSDTYKMAIVEYDGKRLYRKIQGNVSGTVAGRSLNSAPVRRSRFDVNSRFGFIVDITTMVINGESNSVIITGSGGLGKTYTVMECLRTAGFEETQWAPADEESSSAGDYEVVKGFITPKALYRRLYENRGRLIVFDDCDSVWDNPTTVSLLKAALDSYETRKISWFSESMTDDESLPQQFEFKGKIIFVSNLSLSDLDQSILSRCLYVDVSMTSVEKIERIRSLASKIRPDMTAEMKDEVITVLDKHKDDIGDLNIRTFLKGCEIRHRGGSNWSDLMEYVITAM